MKIALVCDWLTNVGGAEKVLLAIHRLYPDAPIYTSKYSRRGIDWFDDADVRTGWLQIFPTGWRRILGPLRQLWFSHLDLSEYDLVISVTGAEAKAVKAPNGVHISYCHVPTQYYWQMYDEYLRNPGFGILNPIVRLFFKLWAKTMRRADYKAAQRVDQFVTISDYAKEQILRYYDRESTVIYPPVEVSDFAHGTKTKLNEAEIERELGFNMREAYIVTSRQVTWKRIDLAVRACLKLKQPLVIIGEGPEHRKLMRMAGNSELIKFLPLMKKAELADYLRLAKCYLFPSLEPFGIAPVEALAAGCPVIAFEEGGARNYVIDGENGLLFDRQTVSSLVSAMIKFEKTSFKRAAVAKTAKGFSVERFNQELRKFIDENSW